MRTFIGILVVTTALLVGCGKEGENAGQKKGPPPTPVTTAPVTTTTANVSEKVLGRVESAASPQVFAEVPGTVMRVMVDVGDQVAPGEVLAEIDTADLRLALEASRAEMGRIEALHLTQQRTSARIERLHREKLVSEGALEESQAQLKSLAEQLAGAKARHSSAQRALAKARIVAPVSGVIELRRIAPGDYLDGRSAIFRIASDDSLRVHLPFPEAYATRLRPGLTVRLTSPMAPERVVTGVVDTVTPAVNGNSHTVEAIVHLNGAEGLSEGASVNAELILDQHTHALMVPESSVVRRPAGEVVYAIKGNTAEQRIVTTGVRQNGLVEILSGLQGDEMVAVDGAGFLTDKATVAVKK